MFNGDWPITVTENFRRATQRFSQAAQPFNINQAAQPFSINQAAERFNGFCCCDSARCRNSLALARHG
ncbi:MAG: hypothetical protein EBZ06_06015 [Betaproteobacteria bacterium]|nr:hypothetical protein [Betaproteobacteria bacterium]NCX80939.1 hypothetical protein [Betaproteobacteria bacterium]NDA23865.1 hypothetical protein [Betaproteobacteria bacterium]NDD76427.1 hypothetical protein [Betaproteobacteria bacterium]NDG17229.1 hypothetical protein [Betaproteobacteria bacterium]